MELRDIEIFLTLAEELHFGRTADRLHVSVARVSQAIKKQERGIGAELFKRDSRNVWLTPVGERLRDDLQPIYRGLQASLERAALAAEDKIAVLRIGTVASNAYELRSYWEAFRSRHPDWALRIRHNPFPNVFGPLRNGEIDALITWLPVEEYDLTVGPTVFTEPMVIAAAADHPLADQRAVSLEVLGDHGIAGPSVEARPDYYEDAFHPFHTPSGRPIERGPAPLETLDQLFTIISSGENLHTLSAHHARYHARPDIAYLPVHDVPPMRWGLVWRSGAENALLRALVEVVRDLGTPHL